MNENKILFLVEPYVIRENAITFKWIADKYLKIARLDPQTCRVLCNSITAAAVIQDDLDKSVVITPTNEEQYTFLQGAVPEWDDRQVLKWRDHMLGVASHNDQYQNMLYRVREFFPFDVVVFWGTSRIVSEFCRKTGVIPYFSELGPVRLPFGETSCVDTLGVNGDAFPTRLSISDLDTVVTQPPTPYVHQNEAPYVLIPLQNADDANILVHGDETAYEDFLSEAVQETLRHGLTPLVKTHPGARIKAYTFAKEVQTIERLRKMGATILDASLSAQQSKSLLSNAHSVLTFNSSIGFEASQLGIPVHVNGKAVYKIRGVFPSLKEIYKADFDHITYMESTVRLGVFMRKYLFPLEAAFSRPTFDFLLKEKTDHRKSPLISSIKGRDFNAPLNFERVQDDEFELTKIIKNPKKILIFFIIPKGYEKYNSLPTILGDNNGNKFPIEIYVIDKNDIEFNSCEIIGKCNENGYQYINIYNKNTIDEIKITSTEHDSSFVVISNFNLDLDYFYLNIINDIFNKHHHISMATMLTDMENEENTPLIIHKNVLFIRSSFLQSMTNNKVDSGSITEAFSALHYETIRRGFKCAFISNQSLELSVQREKNITPF